MVEQVRYRPSWHRSGIVGTISPGPADPPNFRTTTVGGPPRDAGLKHRLRAASWHPNWQNEANYRDQRSMTILKQFEAVTYIKLSVRGSDSEYCEVCHQRMVRWNSDLKPVCKLIKR